MIAFLFYIILENFPILKWKYSKNLHIKQEYIDKKDLTADNL